jgi:hypothetical protein
VFTPNGKSADRSPEPPGIVVIRFQLARSPDELFKWHWAVPPALRRFPNRRFLTAVKVLTDTIRLVCEYMSINS